MIEETEWNTGEYSPNEVLNVTNLPSMVNPTLSFKKSTKCQVKMQFDNDDPVDLGTCDDNFVIRLSAANGCDDANIVFRAGEKTFKLFLTEIK